MKSIPLSQGKFATVDDADYPTVSPFNWCAQKRKNGWHAGEFATLNFPDLTPETKPGTVCPAND
jgi:hypothetical protein